MTAVHVAFRLLRLRDNACFWMKQVVSINSAHNRRAKMSCCVCKRHFPQKQYLRYCRHVSIAAFPYLHKDDDEYTDKGISCSFPTSAECGELSERCCHRWVVVVQPGQTDLAISGFSFASLCAVFGNILANRLKDVELKLKAVEVPRRRGLWERPRGSISFQCATTVLAVRALSWRWEPGGGGRLRTASTVCRCRRR